LLFGNALPVSLHDDLRQAGYTLHAAKTEADALSALQQYKPVGVLVSVSDPVLNGIRFCGLAKAEDSNVRVIALHQGEPYLQQAALVAGADVVILRHPESVRLVRSFIQLMIQGGKASDVKGIAKRMPFQEVDLAAISPKPVLGVAKDSAAAKAKEDKPKEAAKPAPKAEKKDEKPKAPPKQEPKVAEMKPKPEEDAKAKAEAEKKAKAEAEARAKAEAEAKIQAEARAKAEAEARAREEAKRKAEDEARKKAEAKEKEQDDLAALRQKRGVQKAAPEGEKKHEVPAKKPRAAEPVTPIEKLIANLDRIHRRI
jgi:acetyl-CoA decarbonylase/synthase complex subunit delta